MPGPGRAIAILLALVISLLALLLLAGHGPWSGRTLIDFGGRHGLNTGDLPVLLLWAVGMGGCSYLLFRRH
ncbi:hypothetical protein NSZ01_13880 [Nocardioides szechwanensis]|uniref:Uncharacterized protein n=1 Tax=Nocardioides szechwanensis TaxID=1005944 RepID=A0A1H0BTH5_9ACTN|nr:hypothetical protein [Nocardioides szechwanensis]GEP33620.1 hypothetical protein NSZ01_13880 [Nocardioides szechwanensis]SDN48962.1 hypothetical protein SAMN05192576_2228 [Nocardioides szechwanensis]